MDLNFNIKQSEALSSFFFEVAKGLALGVIGFNVVTAGIHPVLRIWLIATSFIMAFFCVMMGLDLLKK
ncbi:hypothetical protein KKB40_05680 [Patescibacteria group bacterium]|nr:hypothetical protein [Patescibacteria group bacterium]